MKRSIALCLICILLFGCMGALPVMAAESILKNGSFDTVKTDGSPENWTLSGSTFGKSFTLSEDGHTGKSLCFKGEEASLFASQVVNGINGGEVYTLSTWFKSVQNGGMVIKIEFYGAYNEHTEMTLKPQKMGQWEYFEKEITIPAGATKMSILLRMFSGGEGYYDDVQFVPTGEKKEVQLIKSTQDVPTDMILPEGKVNFLYNVGFEAEKADGAPKSWNLSGGTFGESFALSKDGRTGKALELHGSESGTGINQSIEGIIGGETYTVTVYGKGTASIKVTAQFTDRSTDTVKWLEAPSKDLKFASSKWTAQTAEIKAPDGADSASVMFRIFTDATLSVDDITFVGKTSIEPVIEPETEFAEPIDGKYLIKNASFEEGGENYTAYKNWGEGVVSIASDEVHSGKYALKLGGSGWAAQKIDDIDPGATYEAQAWLNTYVNGALFKIEVYDKEGKYISKYSKHSLQFEPTDGKWKKVTAVVPTPKEAGHIILYFRTFSDSGIVYYDDVQLVKTADPTPLSMKTDRVFYYTDTEGYGQATADVFTSRFPELVGGRVEYTFIYNDKVLAGETVTVPENGVAEFRYDLDLITEKKQAYWIRADLYNKDGEKKGEAAQDVYKYDRPLYFGADGIYNDGSGEDFIPTFVYHIKKDDYERIGNVGMNVFQTYTGGAKENLDAAHALGKKCLVVLYSNMLPAGHADNAEGTKRTVEALKDHPAVFAWAVMDEPSVYSLDPAAESWLQNSYKIIRDIDDKHPVYIVDAGSYGVCAKYSDMNAFDVYISGAAAQKKATTYVTDMYISNGYDKPTYGLYLSGNAGEVTGITADAMRNQTYQGYYEGAFGIGGYTGSADKYQMEYGKYREEMEDAYRHFVLGEYPIFNDFCGENVRYRGYVKNGEIYLTVFSTGADEKQTVEVNMTSIDGSVTLNGFTAELLAGGAYMADSIDGTGDANKVAVQVGQENEMGAEAVVGKANGVYQYEKTEHEGSTMTVTVGLANAAYYKITPREAVDFSGLISPGRFKDLNGHSWARTAITRLDEKEIVNDIGAFGFGPAKPITRGELAMFLVRTLGLTGDGENFADVDLDAEYAKEIAIGKANGILQGVGNNRFNPEAEITRQDMMTIISRGMQLAGTADLSAFSDAGLIADYAAAHVSAMIASGLIRGNADGTLNPLGNTTRAEAAVIMERILQR